VVEAEVGAANWTMLFMNCEGVMEGTEAVAWLFVTVVGTTILLLLAGMRDDVVVVAVVDAGMSLFM
jgi:hypothetical protein